MIQNRQWKRHLKVGLWVAVIVAVVIIGIALVNPHNPVLNQRVRFLAWPFRALVDFLPPLQNALDSLPEILVAWNVVLFDAAVWGALAALISAILSLLFSRETKPTPPR